MTLIYESSNGERFNLMQSPIFCQNPEALAATDWKYTASAGPGVKPRISKIYRPAKEHSLTLAVFADDAEEFNAIMRKLHEAFETDVRSKRPGKMWWGDYYKPVYIVATEHAEFDEDFEETEEAVTVIALSQYWISPAKGEYRAAESQETEEWLDYAFDYAADYKKALTVSKLQNDSMFESDFALTIYGPCQNPVITIGEAPYALTVSLGSGERVTVDSSAQTIRRTSSKGVEENAFRTWTDKEHYIFRKIPPGRVAVGWSKLFDFDLTVFRERNTPEWI